MKKVIHVDINSYFATMEQQAYPNLRGKPVGVAGKGRGERTVIAGASIEAKKWGIKSGTSTWEAVRMCPELIIVPADYDRYIFISKRIFSLLERFSPNVDVFSIDEAFIDLDDKVSWEDSVKIAEQIKKMIKTQIGDWVTCSIGISYGKTLAKLASEMKKPDGLIIIRPEDFAAIAETMPIEELCGIGYRLRPRLNRLGIFTIAQLGQSPKELLTAVFGEFTGNWMHNIGNGIDANIIRSFRSLPQEKSVGHAYTLPKDVHSPAEAKKVMMLLAERVAVRLRRKGLIGRTISIYVRFHDKTGWGGRITRKDYTQDGYDIYQEGERILDRLGGAFIPIRLVAITVSGLVQQIQVTDFLFKEPRRNDQLIKAIDKINHHYGEFTVFRGTLASIKGRIFNLPDGRNKRIYLPQINEVNSFTKRF